MTGRSRTVAHPAGELVTEEDIRSCYRLILGRPADRAGLEYWGSAVGRMTVAELVGGFFDSREFHVSGLYNRIADSAGRSHRGTVGALQRVELGDRVQFVDPGDGFVGGAILDAGEYEPHVTRAIGEVLKEGDHFVDIGANIGWFSLMAAARVGPGGFVLALEADPDNAEVLTRSVDANGFGHVLVLPVAVSDTNGRMVLQRAGGSNAAVFPTDGPAAAGDRMVPTVTLAALGAMIDRIDVMKVDVEGAELLVFRGATELVRRHRPVLFFEYSPGMLERLPGSSPDGLQAWLTDVGYSLEVIEHDGGLATIGSLDEATRYASSHRHDHIDLKASPGPPS